MQKNMMMLLKDLGHVTVQHHKFNSKNRKIKANVFVLLI